MHSHAPHPSPAVDWLGQALSLICLVHCIATPLLLVLAPALAGLLGGWHPVLWALVVLAAGLAFVPGVRHHGNWSVVGWAALGISLLAAGAFWETGVPWSEPLLSITGALTMLYAHWRNRTLKNACCVPEGHLAHG